MYLVSSPLNTVLMLIYCPELSPRLNYILKLLLGDLMGIEYSTTNIKNEFLFFEGPKLNYSFEPIDSTAFLSASGMLFEHKVIDQRKAMGEVFKWTELPVFYKSYGNSIIPFDIFSASFYLVSRFEEYLPFEADHHGRFPSSESIASKEKFLNKPLIDLWAIRFGEVLNQIFGDDIKPKPPEYRYIPTIDIDNAWAFKNKGLRGIGSLLRKDLGIEERNYRYQVMRGKQTDPYDQYLFLEKLFDKHNLNPIYFFLIGRLERYDRNVSSASKKFRRLIQETSQENYIGIHPSYRSNLQAEIVQDEILKLSKICGHKITRSRQHFLILHLPETYRNLLHLGILEEYSMGYADQLGFRASIANPFNFFDLESNKTTDLIVYPFQVMDVTLRDYLKLTPDEAIEQIGKIITETKAVGGTFSSLWHNESLSEWKEWTGWSRVFIQMLEMSV